MTALRSDTAAAEPARLDGVPASFAQRQFWLLEQLAGRPDEYAISAAWTVCGELDEEALAAALSHLVERHETLRTAFRLEGEELVQVVMPAAPVRLRAREAGTRRPTDAARELRDELLAEPFDLAGGRLLRAGLARLGPEERVLAVAVHHAAADGWSIRVLARELGAAYMALVRGKAPPLEPLETSYRDVAATERERWTEARLEDELAFWGRALEGAPTLDLPADRRRPAVRSGSGGAVPVRLGRGLSERVDALARRAGVTPFMVLVAAYQALLARLSRQRDVLVGTTVANRSEPELEALVGPFVNTVVLRGDLDGEPSFLDLLARTRERALDVYEHQELPFERLVEELRPARDVSRTPLFQALVMLQDAAAPPAFGGLETEALDLEPASAQVDLSLYLRRRSGTLEGRLEYNSDIFDRETVARWAGHLSTLLEAATAHPERRLSDLPLMTEAERQALLTRWNATERAVPERGVHELFEEQAARRPDALAVSAGEEQVSYEELDRCANRLAHALRERGVGPDVLVAIALDRSIQLVVAVLAVLKAGGAYLPLDPDYPPERLAFMLEDAAPRVLLTTEAIQRRLPRSSAELLLVDEARELPDNRPPARAGPAHLAYVIYTSGSSGRPKGVLVHHGGLVSSIGWRRRALLGRGERRVLQFSSPSFDGAPADMFLALTSGATLEVVPADRLVGEPLLDVLAEREIDCVTVPPSLLASLRPRELPGLETLAVAGEPCHPAVATSWAPGRRFVNIYGPTETTIVSTAAVVQTGEDPVPIGLPIDNTTVYVLDERLEPVPLGVPGELFIGGAGVARGYLGRPGLTAERFLPDPFAARPGARMYRTGDLVRQRGDGQLLFLGRTDNQVQLRGFRVEPGEVETRLLEHEAVAEAVVDAVDRGDGDQRLVAYVVPSPDAAVDAAKLRDHLRRRLPAYMVPGAFVTLDAIPVTPNGKVDRRALPAPADRDVERAEDRAPPRPGLERTVAATWARLLGVSELGRHDDFFALGGHSLLATRAVAAVNEAAGTRLGVRTLFELPTVAEFTRAVERDGAESGGAPEHALRPVERSGGTVLSPGQRRLWFLDRFAPGSAEYVVAQAWRLRGELDREALRTALSSVVARHEVLRSRIVRDGEEPVQVVDPPAPVPLPVTEVTDERAEAAALAAEAAAPFDLAAGPMLRARLLARGPREHVLAVAMHHVVSDGWSMRVLAEELAASYRAARQGREPDLPPLPVQYGDFAVWQEAWLGEEAPAAQIEYWRRRLDGLEPLDLPADRPRPAVRSGAGDVMRFALEPELVERARRLGRDADATLFMALLSAFQVLLARLSGQSDVAVATPTAGRPRSELEGLVGFFVNTLVLRAELGDEPTFAELLRRTRTRALEAYANQDVPFERVVDELHPDRDPGRTPLFGALFALDEEIEVPQLDGLEVGLVRIPRRVAKTDLSLVLTPARDGALSGALEYSTDLFDRGTVERWAGHLRTLLRALVERPKEPVSRLPLLTPQERRRAIATATGPAAGVRRPHGLHERFRIHAERAPDALAVADGAAALTYGEVQLRANRLAHELRDLGVRRGSRVGIWAGPSSAFAVGALAVFAAGAAYVPFDPEHPEQRLSAMLRDSGVQAMLAPSAPGDARWCDVPLLEIEPPGRGAAEPPALPQTGRHDAAYVIYTSGSTGRPKGVVVPHLGVVNLLDAFDELCRLRPEDRGSWLTSPSWDVCLYELFSPLVAGSSLNVVPPRARVDGPALAAWLHEERITSAYVPAFLLDDVAGYLENGGRLALRRLEVGAEPIPEAVVGRIRDRIPSLAVINGYGPAETTICATLHLVGSSARPGRIPIGRPVPNVSAHVLDEQLEPVPVGVVGEIAIGGAGLAHGYLGDPARTAERFVPDPLSDVPGARLYRSGDLGRIGPDGVLHFVGRCDHQVKIRGQRIELGEVEAALAEHPLVRQAAVVLKAVRLVAYVVAAETGRLTEAEVRAHARSLLPHAMVPAQVVFLDELPLTATRKVDRAALPDPAPESAASGTAPRTPTERALAVAWANVLGLERVHVEDDFFALGGDSLAATRAMFRTGDTLGRELPVRMLFEHRLLGDLAAAIDGESAQAPPGPGAAADVLRAAARLDPSIRPRGRRRATGGALLTGATGFLGAFVLRELLAERDGPVVCLVRAPDRRAAAERLGASLERYGLAELAVQPRVAIVPGDLSRPGLDLAPADYADLRERVADVYHCAAETDLLAGWDELAPANVAGTHHLLAFACDGAAVPVHHVSTVSVLRADGAEIVPEALEDELPASGYVQTKWAAEQLVAQAAERGLPTTIHRPARIAADSASGAWNERDLLARLLIGCVRLGAAPELRTVTRLVPVDTVARALVRLSADPDGVRYRLEHPEPAPFASLLEAVEAWGVPLRRLTVDDWIATARSRLDHDSLVLPILPLVAELRDPPPERRADAGGLDGLRAAGVEPPGMAELVHSTLSFMARSGLIDPPSRR